MEAGGTPCAPDAVLSGHWMSTTTSDPVGVDDQRPGVCIDDERH
jgi:hypothetical protein